MKVKSKRFPGVYVYHSTVRDDECYYITYTDNRRKVTKKIGWKSEGYSQAMANNLRGSFIMDSRKPLEVNPVPVGHYTFDNAFNLYLESCMLTMGMDRRKLLTGMYEKHLYIIGHNILSMVTPTDVRSILQRLSLEGLSRSTIKKYLALINSVYEFIIKEYGEIPNPCDNVVFKAPDRARQRYLTRLEANYLLIATKKADDDLFLQTVIAMFTGMRLREIMNLRYIDIDFTSDLIHVRGKGRAGNQKERTVEMNSAVKGAIERFNPWKFGKVFSAGFNRRKFQKIVDKLGFNDDCEGNIWKVTFHTLRHTFGSWLGQDGIAPQIIQQVMGHSNVQTSMRYVKLGPRAGQKAVANLTKGIDI